MINEIMPHKFNNLYKDILPKIGDYFLCYRGRQVLLLRQNDELVMPKITKETKGVFLFSIDEDDFFLIDEKDVLDLETYEFHPITILRQFKPSHLAYAGICGKHIYTFLIRSKYCGLCGSLTKHSHTEQAVTCECGNVIYPCIMPAIIVGITYKDKILLAKAARGDYHNFSLVSGYVEFGETLEEAVVREVKEEVGLDVYNVRYYKNQPWGFSNALMIGFFAEAKDSKITLQESELKEAKWFDKDEITDLNPKVSISHEMIQKMKDSLKNNTA